MEDASDYYQCVQQAARALSRRIPGHRREQMIEDFVQEGWLALLQAQERYSPEKYPSVSLWQFASIRVHCAMIDLLRRQDHIPRGIRRHLAAIDAYAAQHGVSHEAALLALFRGKPTQVEYIRTRITEVVSLDSPLWGDNPTLLVELIDGNAPCPLEVIIAQDSQRVATASVATLPRRERFVIDACTLGDSRLKEAATALGVTESRACQLRQDGLKRLRFQLRERLS